MVALELRLRVTSPELLALPWSEPLVQFWERLGAAIRVDAQDAGPSEQGNLLVRTLDVRPSVVTSTTALDLSPA